MACSAPGLFGFCSQDSGNKSEMVRSVVISLALAAITAVAAYYCVTIGLNGLDRAYTSLALCKFGILTYVGAAFGVAAVVNTAFAIFGRPVTVKEQVAGTIGAPLAAIALGGWAILTGRVQSMMWRR